MKPMQQLEQQLVEQQQLVQLVVVVVVVERPDWRGVAAAEHCAHEDDLTRDVEPLAHEP